MSLRLEHIYILLFVLLSTLFGCEREFGAVRSVSDLLLSTDTISFDTLFAGDRSTTAILKLYNLSDEDLNVASISLAGSDKSSFRINIDGQALSKLTNIRLYSKDSLYIFIDVTAGVDDGSSNAFYDDRIDVISSGFSWSCALMAYSLNAKVLDDVVITSDTLLTAELPFRIKGELKVESNATLRLQEGTIVYMSPESRIEVYGSISAEGTTESPVVIRGDRLDKFYNNVPAQWDWICLNRGASNSLFRNVNISGAKYNLQIDSAVSVVVENSLMRDASEGVVLSYGGNVVIGNSLLYNSGGSLVKQVGGSLEMIHCTLSNRYEWDDRRVASLVVRSAGDSGGPNLTTSLVANSIITGNHQPETECDTMLVVFDHCLTEKVNFVKAGRYNFHIDTASVAARSANPDYLYRYPVDLDGNLRDVERPSIGVYEPKTVGEAPLK